MKKIKILETVLAVSVLFNFFSACASKPKTARIVEKQSSGEVQHENDAEDDGEPVDINDPGWAK